VKLVVSGHTHDHRWMPAKPGQPIAQLIGGGPQLRAATLIEGTATRATLALKMTRPDGTLLHEVKLNA
jgi:acid phosphatase type 7